MLSKTVKRKIGAALYYTVGRKLPPSWSGIKVGQRELRGLCGKLMLDNCGKHVNIEQNALFSRKVSLGDYSGIGINARIYGKCSIGSHVMMGSDVTIVTRNHRFDRTDIPMDMQRSEIPMTDEELYACIQKNVKTGGAGKDELPNSICSGNQDLESIAKYIISEIRKAKRPVFLLEKI